MFEYIMICLIMLHRYLWLYSDSEAFTNVFGSELISDVMGNLVLNLSGLYDLYIERKNPKFLVPIQFRSRDIGILSFGHN